MCSTPRPKRQIKSSSSQHTGSILASMSTEARQAFVARANAAADKRYQQQQSAHKKSLAQRTNGFRRNNKAKAVQNHQYTVWQHFMAWLQLPIADIWHALMIGKKH